MVNAELRKEIRAALVAPYQGLEIVSDEPIVLEGSFPILENGVLIESYQLRITVPADFPSERPIVEETSNKFAHTSERHCFLDESCCIVLWEEWMILRSNSSFRTYLDVAVRNYFLGQFVFENTGEWPFDQRSHNFWGVQEAFADILGVKEDYSEICDMLLLLELRSGYQKRPCFCGSGRKVRDCHKEQVVTQMNRISAAMARRMRSKMRAFAREAVDAFEERQQKERELQRIIRNAVGGLT